MGRYKGAPDVVLQSELQILAEFEARYFASLKGITDRVAAGCEIEDGPLAIDPLAITHAGAAVVPAHVLAYSDEPGIPGCIMTPAMESAGARSRPLLEVLERLQPMSRLLNQADLDFMRRKGSSWLAVWRLRRTRAQLYFAYLQVLKGAIDRELVVWARYLGQPGCTFEDLDRARWRITKTMWLLKLDGWLFRLYLPMDAQSPERRLGELRGSVPAFRVA